MSFHKITRFLWAVALVALPVTSFRYFPFLGSTTYVRPLALYPLAALMLVLLVGLWRRQVPAPIPGALLLLGLFVISIALSIVAGWLDAPVPMRGQSYLDRAVRALVTLAVGLVFFVSAVWMVRDRNDFLFSVRWMLVGMATALAWSGVQALTFYTPLLDKVTVTHWQLAFSMRELVRTNRISGLAYEPSWLAGQITTLYMPILVGALLARTQLTWRKWLDVVLLGATTVVLLMTYSRGGLLITVCVTGLVVLLAGFGEFRRAWGWFIGGFRGTLLAQALRIAIVAALLGALVGAFAFLSQKAYFSRLWQFRGESLSRYIVSINAGARSAYAAGALGAFEDHPVLGVGLGASGFYIFDHLPDWALTTVPEIARQLDPGNRLFPNPKNMYIRLLAETGLLGFVLYLVFQASVLGDVLVNFRKGDAYRFAAMAGLFAWLAIALYNFTQDSLATPNIWILPGMLVGLTRSEV